MMYCHPHPELALRPLPSHRERYKKATLFGLDSRVKPEDDIKGRVEGEEDSFLFSPLP